MKKLGIAGDHAGFEYKLKLKEDLAKQGYELVDYGPGSADSVDYPDYVHPLADAVVSGEVEQGIAICGSGNGVAMTANKHKKVRAALCWNQEIAMLAKQHNNANVVCIPARFISKEETLKIVKSFIETNFEGGRHERRVNKI